MFLRFLLTEGLIYGFSTNEYSILIHLKYSNNAPIVREIHCFPRVYWTNFSSAKQLANIKTDIFLQSHLIIVFTLHGFSLLRDVLEKEGG